MKPGKKNNISKSKKTLELREEKYRKQYVAAQQKQQEKAETERLARMQKAFSPERLPASDR